MSRELLQQALDALETKYSDYIYDGAGSAIAGAFEDDVAALRAALAQPAPAVQVVLRQPNLFAADPAAPAVNCEWTNCPRRVGDVCCNDRPAAPAVPDGLRGAVNALLHQIEIGDFVDSNGHSAKMLKPVHDLMRLLSESAATAVPDDVLRALLKHNEELFAAYRARTAVPAVPAVREPLTDEQVSYLEQQAFASTNHTIERPIYQHWFRKGVRAGYGITGDSNG